MLWAIGVLLLIIVELSNEYEIYLTFRVASGTTDCYYEKIDLSIHTGYVDVEYAVIRGGDMDIDATVKFRKTGSFDNVMIYDGGRSKFGEYSEVLQDSGILEMCFSNEFSLFSTKAISLELYLQQKPFKERPEFTESETFRILERVTTNLRPIQRIQWTHLVESQRTAKLAEELNDRILWSTGIMTFGFMIIGFLQVCLLKRFFKDKKPSRLGPPMTALPPPPQYPQYKEPLPNNFGYFN